MKNHPKKGSRIKVEPIRDKAEIDRIKKVLKTEPRNLALFVFGINTNLRASDLVRIQVDQVHDLQSGDSFELREKKTGKVRRITINNGTGKILQNWINAGKLRHQDPLFQSQRGGRLTVSSVHRLVKGWCREIGMKGNYGSHSLRKTWGYHAHRAGISIPILMTCYNHSSQQQTLQYLCIQDSEIQDVYLKVEL